MPPKLQKKNKKKWVYTLHSRQILGQICPGILRRILAKHKYFLILWGCLLWGSISWIGAFSGKKYGQWKRANPWKFDNRINFMSKKNFGKLWVVNTIFLFCLALPRRTTFWPSSMVYIYRHSPIFSSVTKKLF